jgi:uncharacterized protein (TIGR00725 family)
MARKIRHIHRKTGLIAGMRMKIGVMGGASSDIKPDYLAQAAKLGRAIAQRGCILVTGACPGLPLAAADAARNEGGFVVGISPGLSLDEHIYKYGSPAEGHDVLIFTGSGLMGREVVNIRSSDIVVIIGGRAGTLGEFAIAYDEGKLIGVLTGTGGVTTIIPSIIDVCKKNTGARVIFESDPSQLIDELLAVYASSHYKHPSCFSLDKRAMGTQPRTMRDHVCGMWLAPDQAAATRQHKNKRFVFCCNACAETFDRNPAQYENAHQE